MHVYKYSGTKQTRWVFVWFKAEVLDVGDNLKDKHSYDYATLIVPTELDTYYAFG